MSAYSVQKRAERAAIVREMGLLVTQGTPSAMARRKELDDQQTRLHEEIESCELRESFQLPNVDTRHGYGSSMGNFGVELSPQEQMRSSDE
jgi:hypothetical protein